MNLLRRMTLIKVGIFLLLASLLSGCVSSADRIMSDARRFSAVTRIDPNFNPERGSQLVWFSDLIVQDSSAGLQATAQQVSVIQGTIESQLMRKYYRFTENRDDADYMVAAALVMDDSVQSQEITDLVQIFPGLANAFNDLESGTLLVVITAPTDPRTAPLLWRGAIQAYTVGEALPDQMRLDRLRSFTARLIDAVPEARN